MGFSSQRWFSETDRIRLRKEVMRKEKPDYSNTEKQGLLYTENLYLSFDPFEGDMDVDIRRKTVRMVKTRKPHQCVTVLGQEQHIIETGSIARYEKAIVDGMWCNYYVCIDCLNKWLDEFYFLEA